MKKYISFTAVLLFSIHLFFSCRSIKPVAAIGSIVPKSELTANSCEKTIKYTSNKAIDLRGQTEIEMSIEIIIDPSEKMITLNLESPQKGKGTITAAMLDSDCNLDASLTTGYSVYRAIGQNSDGHQPEVSFRVEANKDGLTIVYTAEKEKGELLIKVAKWEVVND